MKICVNLNEDWHVKACVKPHVKCMWKCVWKGWHRFTPFSHIFHYAKFHMHVKYVCEMHVKSVWKTCEKHVKWEWKQDIFHTFFTWCFTYILLVVSSFNPQGLKLKISPSILNTQCQRHNELVACLISQNNSSNTPCYVLKHPCVLNSESVHVPNQIMKKHDQFLLPLRQNTQILSYTYTF